MTHNPIHGKHGHPSRGPSYTILHAKGEYWNPEKANRRFKRENKINQTTKSGKK